MAISRSSQEQDGVCMAISRSSQERSGRSALHGDLAEFAGAPVCDVGEDTQAAQVYKGRTSRRYAAYPRRLGEVHPRRLGEELLAFRQDVEGRVGCRGVLVQTVYKVRTGSSPTNPEQDRFRINI